MSGKNRLRAYIQASNDFCADSGDISIELRDMVNYYAEIEFLPGNKSKAERKIIESVAENLMVHYPNYLSGKGLIEDFFLIAPNPVNLSTQITSAFTGDKVRYEGALKALRLGGIISASAINRKIAHWEKHMSGITPEFVGLLIKNMKENEWALELDENHSPTAYTRMAGSLFKCLINNNFNNEAADILINESSFLNKLRTDVNLSNIEEYSFLCCLPYSIGQNSVFYQALHERSPYAYEAAVAVNKPHLIQHAAHSLKTGFNIGNMPSSPQFDADFCAETLSSGVYSGSMTKETYKGLLRHFDLLEGNTDSLFKLASSFKKTKDAIRSYVSYSNRLDELGSTCSNVRYRGEMRDRVTAQLYGNISFIEHFYIDGKDHFFATNERRMTYVQAGLHYGDAMKIVTLFNEHKDLFSDPGMVVSLNELALSSEASRRMETVRIIEEMLGDDTLRQAFSFVDKTMHERLFALVGSVARENMRLVGWYDNGIKREMLAHDMNI
jgi:uncharacterized protein YbcI